jgi:hypothetical protein
VLEKANGKVPSDVKFSYVGAKGKNMLSSSVIGYEVEITTRSVTKLNSFVILKGVSLNYDSKKKNRNCLFGNKTVYRFPFRNRL